MSLTLAEETKTKLLAGDFVTAEHDFYRQRQREATEEFKEILTETIESDEGRGIARALKTQHRYKTVRKKEIAITTMTGERIVIPSWYALQAGRKRGRKKKGPNGRGDHLLLRYWGFTDKHSPNYMSVVARTGAASPSYELAAADLKEHGIAVAANSVRNVVEKAGNEAGARRDTIALAPGENFSGKRIIIAIDGGRTRMREDKAGRMKKGQKLRGFSSPWREPKLLVMAELGAEGTYRKDTKPLYEATLDNHEGIFRLLRGLSRRTDVQQASEIVLSGDGAVWIWQQFAAFTQELGIAHKATEILDFYHATEHLTAICEANASLSPHERTRWFTELKKLLRAGRYEELKQNIERESRVKNIPSLTDLFQYFVRNRARIRYDEYEQNRQPIGSGIVESAIRRVINLKLKSPSTFWRQDRLEHMLQLRCILMAGRWRIFTQNLVVAARLALV